MSPDSPQNGTTLALEVQKIVNFIIQAAMPVSLAMLGGLVNVLNQRADRFSFRLFTVGIITAAFAGILMDLLLLHFDAPEKLRISAVALTGYCSRDVLSILKIKLLKQLRQAGGRHD